MHDNRECNVPHCLTLENRERMHLGGITDVKCFDEQTVELVTSSGELIISGNALHIAALQLETGDVHLTGKVDSLQYCERKSRKGKIKGLFR